MNVIAIWDFRAKLSQNLEKVRVFKKSLVFGNRNKKEFLLMPYPDLKDDENLFEIYDDLEDKIIQMDYYKWLESNFSDWNKKENEDLFI